MNKFEELQGNSKYALNENQEVRSEIINIL